MTDIDRRTRVLARGVITGGKCSGFAVKGRLVARRPCGWGSTISAAVMRGGLVRAFRPSGFFLGRFLSRSPPLPLRPVCLRASSGLGGGAPRHSSSPVAGLPLFLLLPHQLPIGSFLSRAAFLVAPPRQIILRRDRRGSILFWPDRTLRLPTLQVL